MADSITFLEISGIAGPSVTDDFVGAFVVDNVAFGAFADPDQGKAGLLGFDQLRVTLDLGTALPSILAQATQDALIASVRMTHTTAAFKGPNATQTVTLGSVAVRDIAVGPSGATLTLEFAKIDVEAFSYIEDGTLIQSTSWNWDQIQQTPLVGEIIEPDVPQDEHHDLTAGLDFYVFFGGKGAPGGPVTIDGLEGAFALSDFGFSATQDAVIGNPDIAEFSDITLDFEMDTAVSAFLTEMSENGLSIDSMRIVGRPPAVGDGKPPATEMFDLRVKGVSITELIEGPGVDSLTIGYTDIYVKTASELAPGEFETSEFGWDLELEKPITGDINVPVSGEFTGSLGEERYFLVLDGFDGGAVVSGVEGAFELTDFSYAPAYGGKLEFDLPPVTVLLDSGSALPDLVAALHQPNDGIASARIVKLGGESAKQEVQREILLGEVAIKNLALQAGDTEITLDYEQIQVKGKDANDEWSARRDGSDIPVNIPEPSPGLGKGGTQFVGSSDLTFMLWIEGVAGPDDIPASAGGVQGLPTTAGFALDGFSFGLEFPYAVEKAQTTFTDVSLDFRVGDALPQILSQMADNASDLKVQILGIVPDSTALDVPAVPFDLRFAGARLFELDHDGVDGSVGLSFDIVQFGAEALDQAFDYAIEVATGSTDKSVNSVDASKPTEGVSAESVQLTFDGIPGPSVTQDFEGTFNVLDHSMSFNGGVQQKPTFETDGLWVTIDAGTALPALIDAMTVGAVDIESAKLESIAVVNKGENPVRQSIKMEKVQIMDLRLGDAGTEVLLTFDEYLVADDDSDFGYDFVNKTPIVNISDASPSGDGTNESGLNGLSFALLVDGLQGPLDNNAVEYAFALEGFDFNLLRDAFASGLQAATMQLTFDAGQDMAGLMELMFPGQDPVRVIQIVGYSDDKDTADVIFDLRLGDVRFRELVDTDGADILDISFDAFHIQVARPDKTIEETFWNVVHDEPGTALPAADPAGIGNAAPKAVNDGQVGDEDTTFTGNVLINDTDAEKDTLTATLQGDAPDGVFSLSEDGDYSWTPEPNFVGQVQFTYKASDGNGGIDTATVLLTVENVNDAPQNGVAMIGADDVGQIWHADTSQLSDADGLGPFSYHWLRNGVEIDGATDADYRLMPADYGEVISVKVTYTDGQGTEETVFADARPAPTVDPQASFAETGKLNLTTKPQTITLERSYDRPVVLAFVATENGKHPVNVRVLEAAGDTVSLKLQEPNYLDGTHGKEEVHYIVIEEGAWRLPDGTLIEAGTLQSNKLSTSGFEHVDFASDFDSRPVVLTQVQTNTGSAFVTTRQTKTDADGFDITMQEEEALNHTGHAKETLGWLAVEAGQGAFGDMAWQAGRVTGINHNENGVQTLQGLETVVAGISSYIGADPVWARGAGVEPFGFAVSAEEDASKDSEVTHTGENLDFFAFTGTGLLPGLQSQTVMETGVSVLTHEETKVSLDSRFDNPVAIAWIATENGKHPVNVRISEVAEDSLTLQLQEPNYLDGAHGKETVYWAVVEQGEWILGDGTKIEAGSLQSGKLSAAGFQSVTFQSDFETRPVVLSQVQTRNGTDFILTRQGEADADGLLITVQEEEALNRGGHAPETLGWIAIEDGMGDVDNFQWLAGRATGVTDAGKTINLPGEVDGVLAGVSSYAGVDPAWARGAGLTAEGFAVSVEEEASANTETQHAAETIDYFAFVGMGPVQGYDPDLFF